MPTSQQRFLNEWVDALLAAATPRQRALLKSGHRIHVKLGDATYLICRADSPLEQDGKDNVFEIPIAIR